MFAAAAAVSAQLLRPAARPLLADRSDSVLAALQQRQRSVLPPAHRGAGEERHTHTHTAGLQDETFDGERRMISRSFSLSHMTFAFCQFSLTYSKVNQPSHMIHFLKTSLLLRGCWGNFWCAFHSADDITASSFTHDKFRNVFPEAAAGTDCHYNLLPNVHFLLLEQQQPHGALTLKINKTRKLWAVSLWNFRSTFKTHSAVIFQSWLKGRNRQAGQRQVFKLKVAADIQSTLSYMLTRSTISSLGRQGGEWSCPPPPAGANS